MVRTLVLKHLYKLSDEQTEYQLLDRMSYQCFCLLEGSATIPAATPSGTTSSAWASMASRPCSRPWTANCCSMAAWPGAGKSLSPQLNRPSLSTYR